MRVTVCVIMALVLISLITPSRKEQPDDQAANSGVQEIIESNQSQQEIGVEYSSDLLVKHTESNQARLFVDEKTPITSIIYTENIDTLHQRSIAELTALATTVADYSEEELLEYSDLYRFTDRLLRIERNSRESLILSEPATYGEISFSNAHIASMGELWEKSVFRTTDSLIVAHMPHIDPEVLGNRILVSWSRIEDRELLLLKTMAMNPELARNNTWMENRSGWEPGEYMVAVYSGDEQLQLLARGEFRISQS